eukprot:s1385_g8.t2
MVFLVVVAFGVAEASIGSWGSCTWLEHIRYGWRWTTQCRANKLGRLISWGEPCPEAIAYTWGASRWPWRFLDILISTEYWLSFVASERDAEGRSRFTPVKDLEVYLHPLGRTAEDEDFSELCLRGPGVCERLHSADGLDLTEASSQGGLVDTKAAVTTAVITTFCVDALSELRLLKQSLDFRSRELQDSRKRLRHTQGRLSQACEDFKAERAGLQAELRALGESGKQLGDSLAAQKALLERQSETLTHERMNVDLLRDEVQRMRDEQRKMPVQEGAPTNLRAARPGEHLWH